MRQMHRMHQTKSKNMAIENELTKGKIKLTDEQSKALQQQVKNWVQENMRAWDAMIAKEKGEEKNESGAQSTDGTTK